MSSKASVTFRVRSFSEAGVRFWSEESFNILNKPMVESKGVVLFSGESPVEVVAKEGQEFIIDILDEVIEERESNQLKESRPSHRGPRGGLKDD